LLFLFYSCKFRTGSVEQCLCCWGGGCDRGPSLIVNLSRSFKVTQLQVYLHPVGSAEQAVFSSMIYKK